MAQVKDLVGHLYKTVKTILLYPPTSNLPAEFKRKLHDRLSEFLDQSGPLTLHVRGDELAYNGETVHEEAGGEDNFIATLTRDGIQQLSFHPGLPLDELDAFLTIVKKVINERCEDDDLVTLLWNASFGHIRYEAVGELDAIDYEAIERQLASNRQQRAVDPGMVNYGSIVLEEGQESNGEEGDAGGAAAGIGTTKSIDSVDVTRILDDLADLSDDLSQVDNYLREATQFDPATSTISIVFEILIGENEIPEFRETCNILDNLYDRFVAQADFNSSHRIQKGLVELEQAEREHSPARARRLAESQSRTADKLRIDQLNEALNANPGCDIDGCRALLTALPVEILPHLVNSLGVLEHFPARKMVCDILAERGADRIDTIGNGMFDKRWYVVRNVAIVLGNIGGPRACTYLEKAVRHADERVRREVVEALARMDPESSSSLLRVALDDEDLDLRLAALRALARRSDVVAGEIAEAHARSSGFRRREPTEQKEWLAALARIKGDAALPTFRGMIGSWAVFDRSARCRLRVLATLALGEADGPEVVNYLEKLSHHRNPDISEAAIRALNRIHRDVTGI